MTTEIIFPGNWSSGRCIRWLADRADWHSGESRTLVTYSFSLHALIRRGPEGKVEQLHSVAEVSVCA